MDCFLNILEEKQLEEIIDETKLRYTASQISIWDFFAIPQADYLAFSKDKKSRMFSKYYKKLVLKYFSSKNIFHFFCLKLYGNCLRLTEMFLVSGF